MSLPLADASMVLQGEPREKARRAAATAKSTSAESPSDTLEKQKRTVNRRSSIKDLRKIKYLRYNTFAKQLRAGQGTKGSDY
jgi:hypothetical protein